jgi:beta-glucosidase
VRVVDSAVARPAKELQGFAKVHLAPGESAPARIALSRRSFTIWDVASAQWRVEPAEYEILVGASSADIRGRAVIEVATPDTVTPVPGTAEPVASDEEFAALLRGPIPEPPPIRPFTRTSTIGDVRSHLVGRALAGAMVAAIRRRVRLEDDQQASQTMATVIDGMPLRAFAQLTDGVAMSVIDRAVALLNGDFRRVIRPQP